MSKYNKPDWNWNSALQFSIPSLGWADGVMANHDTICSSKQLYIIPKQLYITVATAPLPNCALIYCLIFVKVDECQWGQVKSFFFLRNIFQFIPEPAVGAYLHRLMQLPDTVDWVKEAVPSEWVISIYLISSDYYGKLQSELAGSFVLLHVNKKTILNNRFWYFSHIWYPLLI